MGGVVLGKSRKLFIGNAYLPPDTKREALSMLEESIIKVNARANQNDGILLFGDFSMNNIQWELNANDFFLQPIGPFLIAI